MNHTAIRWKHLDAMIWSIWRMGIKQLENTKTKKKPNRTEFHHFMKLAGTQIDVSICFTEYSQLSSLAAELWTPCCPLLVCDNILNHHENMKQMLFGTECDSHTTARRPKNSKTGHCCFSLWLVTITRTRKKAWNKSSLEQSVTHTHTFHQTWLFTHFTNMVHMVVFLNVFCISDSDI